MVAHKILNSAHVQIIGGVKIMIYLLEYLVDRWLLQLVSQWLDICVNTAYNEGPREKKK